MSNYTELYQDDYSYSGNWPSYGNAYDGVTEIELEVTFGGDGSLTASLSIERPIDAALHGDSSDTFPLTLEVALASSLEGDSYLSAEISGVSVPMDVALTGESELTAALNLEQAIQSSLTGEGDDTFNLSQLLAIATELSGDSTDSYDIIREANLILALNGDSSLTASVLINHSIAASFIGDSTFTADAVLALIVAPSLVTGAPPYRVVIADLAGTPLAQVPFSDLMYSFVLNDSGTCSFDLPKHHAKVDRTLMHPGKREIHIFREGQRVWGGYLWYANSTTDSEKVRFAGEGWFSRLRRRVVDPTTNLIFIDEDQLNIAWELIAFTQAKTNGDLGIVRNNPSEVSLVNRTRRYFPYEMANIGDEIIGMTEASTGFDFEITPDKLWKTYFPERGSDIGVLFELGKNIESMTLEWDATELTNDMKGLGSGDRRNRCIVELVDEPSQSDYGLLQDAAEYSDVKHYDTLYGLTQGELRRRRDPRLQPQLKAITNGPIFGAFDIGDKTRVLAHDGYLDIDEQYRIVTRTINVGNEMKETQELLLDEVVV